MIYIYIHRYTYVRPQFYPPSADLVATYIPIRPIYERRRATTGATMGEGRTELKMFSLRV